MPDRSPRHHIVNFEPFLERDLPQRFINLLSRYRLEWMVVQAASGPRRLRRHVSGYLDCVSPLLSTGLPTEPERQCSMGMAIFYCCGAIASGRFRAGCRLDSPIGLRRDRSRLP